MKGATNSAGMPGQLQKTGGTSGADRDRKNLRAIDRAPESGDQRRTPVYSAREIDRIEDAASKTSIA
jgi:hypothetical protein